MGTAGGRRTTFPYGPLDFCDRTILPTAQTEGAAIFAELPGAEGLLLFRLLRLVVSFARGEYDRGWFDADRLGAWEEELLRASGDRRLYGPAAVIVGELMDPEQAEMSQVSYACWCIVEWAADRSPAATVAFAEAAALSWPANPRNALAAGRLIRRAGHAREGEIWIRRARRLAAHYRDWECLVLSSSSLGMLHFTAGNYKLAKQHLERAHRTARRNNLPTLEGEVLHNRFAVAIITGELEAAEEFARAAFERYLPFHPALPALGYDIGYFWLSRGYAARALPIFEALLPHFAEPAPRVQVLSAMSKAAGLVQDPDLFSRCSAEVTAISADVRALTLPAALVDVALGAVALGERETAAAMLEHARSLAEQLSQSDIVLKAEDAITQLSRGHVPNEYRGVTDSEQERFASRFAFVLNELAPASL